MADIGRPVVADQRLYLTRDRTRLVPDGDPEAWTLFCTPGSVVPRAQAARYGLLAARETAPEPEAEADEEPAAPKQRPAQAKPRTARTKPRRPAASKGDDETP
jgi:hypothetical protein